MKLAHIAVCLSLAIAVGSAGSTLKAQSGDGYFLHTVAKGQSLYSIANTYGVGTDDIVRLNPGSDKQIRAGETLKIPRSGDGSNVGKAAFHTVQAGETLYQLTMKYNVTAQAICEANPGLSASNFRAGQVVCIPAQEVQPAPAAQTEPAQVVSEPKRPEWREMHKVKRRETIFGICKEYGITQEELVAANPELKSGKLKRGTYLFIPYPTQEQQTAETVRPAEVQRTPTNEELFSQNAPIAKRMGVVKTAVLLPFTFNDNGILKDNPRMVEYYEGFLLAADSLKRQGVSLDLYAYDTQGSKPVTASILNKPEMKSMNVIFGPVAPANIPQVTDFARKNGIRLVIPFEPKVDQVFNTPEIYQINTPQSYLYPEVYEHFIRKFGQCNVVFLDPANGDKEKADFISGLKNELRDKRISFKQIQLGSVVEAGKVISAMDTARTNIFIPTSGRSSALTRLLPHLTLVRREHPDFDMHLFGYPEWQTYTQEHLASFYELDTYFYTSFYTNNLFPEAVAFTHSYRRWYSKDMANSYPKYGMLGFDTGYFFLKGLAQEGGALEKNLDKVKATPIQTGFKFERVSNWGGFINRKVFFVHITKDFELIKLDFE